MLKRLVCWGIGLLLLAGGGFADAQGTTRPGDKTTGTGGTRLGKEMRGRIVRVDPEKGIVVIRVGTGTDAKEREFRVAKTTRYFGKDNKALTDGLKGTGWKANTDVWFRTTGGENSTNLGELRMGPGPATPGGTGGTGKSGGGAVRPGGPDR